MMMPEWLLMAARLSILYLIFLIVSLIYFHNDISFLKNSLVKHSASVYLFVALFSIAISAPSPLISLPAIFTATAIPLAYIFIYQPNEIIVEANKLILIW